MNKWEKLLWLGCGYHFIMYCHSNMMWSGGSLNHYVSKLASAAIKLGLQAKHLYNVRKIYKVSHLLFFSYIAKHVHNVKMLLFVGCLTSQEHASVSQGQICSDNFTCWHTEIEVADQTFHLTQSQYSDTGPNSPITDPIMPGAWQGSHWSANF